MKVKLEVWQIRGHIIREFDESEFEVFMQAKTAQAAVFGLMEQFGNQGILVPTSICLVEKEFDSEETGANKEYLEQIAQQKKTSKTQKCVLDGMTKISSLNLFDYSAKQFAMCN